MPLYEYQCASCGRFEVIRKFSDKALKKCPTCGKKIEKLASAPAFHLKGTGWYVTDYAKKSNGGAEKGEKDKADKKDSDTKKSESGTKSDAPTGAAKAESDSSTSASSSDSSESKSSTATKPASTSKKSPASGSSPT